MLEYMRVTQDTLRYLVMASWIVHPVTGHWPLLGHPKHCNYPRHRVPWSRQTGSQPHLKKHFQKQVGRGNWHTRLKGNKMQTLPHIFHLFRAWVQSFPCLVSHWLTDSLTEVAETWLAFYLKHVDIVTVPDVYTKVRIGKRLVAIFKSFSVPFFG